MLLLLRLDPADQLSFKAFRLQVKERIYRFNYVRLPFFDVDLVPSFPAGNHVVDGETRASREVGRDVPEYCRGLCEDAHCELMRQEFIIAYPSVYQVLLMWRVSALPWWRHSLAISC